MAKVDLIDRTALVADLECFKVSMGDPVLKLIVARVIDRVKVQPEVKLASLKTDEWAETDSRKLYDVAKGALASARGEFRGVKKCSNCKHFDESASDYPCCRCTLCGDGEPTLWEMMPFENL